MWAVSTKERTTMAANVSNVEEKEVGELSRGSRSGRLAVNRTTRASMNKRHGTLNRAVADPEINRKLVGLGTEVVVSETPAAFSQFVAKNYKLWGEMVDISGLEKK